MYRLIGPTVATLFAVVMTAGVHRIARERAAGTFEFSDSMRSENLEELLLPLADSLGPRGALILGFVLFALLLVWWIFAFRKMRAEKRAADAAAAAGDGN